MNEITWRAAESLSLENFIPYLFVLRLSENTYKVLYLDYKGKFLSYWRNNKPPILQMAIEGNYFITMHHQAGVHFVNFTEVKFRDILLTGTGHRDSPGQTGTYGRSNHL